jgi:hypothetical protein
VCVCVCVIFTDLEARERQAEAHSAEQFQNTRTLEEEVREIQLHSILVSYSDRRTDHTGTFHLNANPSSTHSQVAKTIGILEGR